MKERVSATSKLIFIFLLFIIISSLIIHIYKLPPCDVKFNLDTF